ncbi:hypothetical protein NN561_016195 [Cricetulus griseus]
MKTKQATSPPPKNKPTLPHQQKSYDEVPKEENSVNSQKTGQRRPRGIHWGCTDEGSKSRRAGPTPRDHRGQRARWSRGKANEGRRGRAAKTQRGGGRAGHRARCAGGADWEHPAARRAPRVPADLQRAQDPAPTAGSRLRPGRESRTRRRGRRFLSGPGQEGTRSGSQGREARGAARGDSPLHPRGLRSRLCVGGVRRPAGRRPYPGQHHPAPGPLTSPSQQPQPPQARSQSVRHGVLGSRPSAAAGEHAQSPRSRRSAAGERYLRSTGPGPRPRPWRSPLPLSLRPALSAARPRPLRTPRPAP